MAEIEDDALVEHQPVTPPVGRHEADAATGGGGGVVREPPAVGEDSLAGSRSFAPEQHGEQVGRPGTFYTGESDYLTRSRRERDAAKWSAGQVAHHQLARLALRAPRRRWRKQRIRRSTDHRLDHFGDGKPVAILGQHRTTAAIDGDAMRDREHLL